MTKCDSCGKEVGNLYCGNCRKKIEKETLKTKFGKLLPLLFYDIENKQYVIGCYCVGCPCNNNGLCRTKHLKLPVKFLHEFDGNNIVHQVCG